MTPVSADGAAPVPMSDERRREIEEWMRGCYPRATSVGMMRDLLAEVDRLIAENERLRREGQSLWEAVKDAERSC